MAGIVAGEPSPGERLVEEELAEQLGESRGAIRTALLRLEHDRLIVRERNRGARVRRVTPEEAVEILEARTAVESLAAGYAAVQRTDADVKELRKLTAEMEKLHAAGESPAMSERNAQLHDGVALGHLSSGRGATARKGGVRRSARIRLQNCQQSAHQSR